MNDIAFFSFDKDKKRFEKGEIPFSMQRILPVPNELLHPDAESYGGANAEEKDRLRKNLEAKFGFHSWYDWRCSNWGTKWDLSSDTSFDEIGDEMVTYFFDSAWSPPCDFLKTIAVNYPLLKFHLEYEEPGCAFEGDLEIEGGNIVRDEEREWKQKTCCYCGEELDEGEEFDEEGNCPDCHSEDDEEE